MKLLILLVSISAFAQFQSPVTVMPPPSGTSGAQIRLREAGNNGVNYFGLRAPASMAGNLLYDLPSIDGTAGQVLSTNGGQVLSWTSVSGNTIPVCASTTGNDSYTCTVASFTVYSANYCIILSVDFANVGTATVDISGGGAKSILRYGGSALVTNDILVNSPTMICYDGTQFTLPPSASLGSGAFLNGGNTFGAAATLGTNDAQTLSLETNGTGRWSILTTGHLYAGANNTYDIGAGLSANSPRSIYAATSIVTPKIGRDSSASLTIMTDSADRWIVNSAGMLYPASNDSYDIGLTGTRARGVYAKFGEFYEAGSTSAADYIETRKYKIKDATGSAGSWDMQADIAATVSQLFSRDNVGDPFRYSVRQSSGSPVNYEVLYASLIPGKRDTGLGHTVTDATFPKLGTSSQPWSEIWGTNGDFAGDLTIEGTTVANVLNYASGTMAGTMKPLFGGTGSIGASGYSYGSAFFTASGFTLTDTTTVGYVWTATSTGGAGSWQAASGAALPVVDTTGIAKGSSDATKIVRFEVDGFTSGVTNVLTPQNNSYILAGTNIAQTFSATQTHSADIASSSANANSIGSGATPFGYMAAQYMSAEQHRIVNPGSSHGTYWDWRLQSAGAIRLYSGTGTQIEMDISVISSTNTQFGIRGSIYPTSTSGSNGDIGYSGAPWRSQYLSTSAYMNGTQWMDSSRNLTNLGTGTFSGAITANGGIATGSATNSTLYVGSGNLYLRTYSGSNPSCPGITNGWVGYRTDTDELQICSGGNLKVVGLL